MARLRWVRASLSATPAVAAKTRLLRLARLVTALQIMQTLLARGAYAPWVRENVVQAQ
jgi:hypothetical protein